jgi:transposase
MYTAETLVDETHAVSDEQTAPVPFATVYVTLTKQEHIQLVLDANQSKSLHRRAVERAEWSERRHQHDMLKAAELAQSRVHQLQQEFCQFKDEAAQREATLRTELELSQAKVRELQKRLFGRKGESRSDSEAQPQAPAPRVPRGHQRGAAGHGRTMQAHLPERVEVVGIDEPQCPSCGLALSEFPGTEDSQVLEIEVQAYRRVIRRRRYRPVCDCGCVPGIVSAPPPPRLIERGKFGLSVWTTVLLDKFLYGRPSHRLLHDLGDHGLNMSAGTLAGGLQALAPLFEPLNQALLDKLRGEAHWHADETRWAVFVTREGKVGHRWYLWVFHSPSVVHYVLDPSRAATVIQGELGDQDSGIISCDRYSAYKRFARLNPGVLLAFCWAHQRRDYLELANSHPALSAWAMARVDAISVLYHLNDLRLAVEDGSAERAVRHAALQHAVQCMSSECDTALSDSSLAKPARKVLQSMANHWPGLTVFVDHPWVPMDNNVGERDMRGPVVGRKNFYGSGAEWSAQLAATMYSLLMTVQLWGLNARVWLSTYLQACADSGNQAPPDINEFLPWSMDETRLAAMRAHAPRLLPLAKRIDSS